MKVIKPAYNENVILEFIYTKTFNKIWKAYGLTQKDKEKLELEVKHFEETNTDSSVILGDIIQGTGGAIKWRFQIEEAHKGKSGGYRIIYCKFGRRTYAFLLIYSKSDKESLSNKEKSAIRKTLEAIINEKGAR